MKSYNFVILEILRFKMFLYNVLLSLFHEYSMIL